MTSPDPSPNPPPLPGTEERTRSRSRRRRSRSGSSSMRGRGYVVLLFLLLCGYNVWAYFITEDYRKQTYVAHEIPWFCVTTALFAGVFCRQNWARYFLIALQLLRLGATLVYVPVYIEPMSHSFDLVVSILSGPIVNAVIIWSLISIPSIRRLVVRNSELAQ